MRVLLNMRCVVCILLLAGTVLAASAVPYGEDSANGEPAPTVTNVFYNTNLRDALADIATQTGIIIVSDETVQGIVTCELNEVPLDKALNIILSVGNYAYRSMGDFILVGSADPDSPTFAKLSQTDRIKLDHLPAKSAVAMLSSGLQKYAKPDEATNAICITAPPEIITRITHDIRRLDMSPDQVLLDARIVVMENGNLLDMGLQWDFPQVSAGAFTDDAQFGTGAPPGPDWPWGIRVGYTPSREFTNSLLVTLNLLAQNDDATVVASPQVMTEDKKTAEFSVTTEEYFEILTRGYYDSSELEKIEAGTVLKILPTVKQDDSISLEMRAEVSDVVARGANNFPVVTRRVAESTVHVENGGTAVVAGLLDNRSRTLKDHVPFLGRIPIIGLLFRNVARTSSSRQVAVFVTARLVQDDENGGVRMDPRVIKPVDRELFNTFLRTSLQKIENGQ
ncbi:hypothetical protein HQ520_14625 [bacterium]|nr:hypothetical protein [bacterium]